MGNYRSFGNGGASGLAAMGNYRSFGNGGASALLGDLIGIAIRTEIAHRPIVSICCYRRRKENLPPLAGLVVVPRRLGGCPDSVDTGHNPLDRSSLLKLDQLFQALNHRLNVSRLAWRALGSGFSLRSRGTRESLRSWRTGWTWGSWVAVPAINTVPPLWDGDGALGSAHLVHCPDVPAFASVLSSRWSMHHAPLHKLAGCLPEPWVAYFVLFWHGRQIGEVSRGEIMDLLGFDIDGAGLPPDGSKGEERK
jgi:hypothetical protein